MAREKKAYPQLLALNYLVLRNLLSESTAEDTHTLRGVSQSLGEVGKAKFGGKLLLILIYIDNRLIGAIRDGLPSSASLLMKVAQ